MLNFSRFLLVQETNNSLASAGKKRICAFDFDGTLANTPAKPETPEAIRKSGWDGKDWYGSNISIPDNTQFNDEVVAAFKSARQDPETYTLLLTGRRGVIAPKVRKLLQRNDLIGKRKIGPTNANAVRHHAGQEHPAEDTDPNCLDEYYCGDFNTEDDYPKTTRGKADGSTLAHKVYVIKKLMYDGIVQIDFWDDRGDHIPHFIKLGMDLQKQWPNLTKVTMHRVYPPQHPGQPAWVQHIPIKNR